MLALLLKMPYNELIPREEHKMNNSNNKIRKMVNEAKSFEDIQNIPDLYDITDIVMDESLSDQEVLMLLVEGVDEDADIGEEW